MPYTDYNFYAVCYKGESIQTAEFERLELRASSYIDSLNLLDSTVDSPFKMAVCAVADEIKKSENGGELQSQSVGGWSKSYVTSGKTAVDRMYDAAKLYLGTRISRVGWC